MLSLRQERKSQSQLSSTQRTQLVVQNSIMYHKMCYHCIHYYYLSFSIIWFTNNLELLPKLLAYVTLGKAIRNYRVPRRAGKMAADSTQAKTADLHETIGRLFLKLTQGLTKKKQIYIRFLPHFATFKVLPAPSAVSFTWHELQLLFLIN